MRNSFRGCLMVLISFLTFGPSASWAETVSSPFANEVLAPLVDPSETGPYPVSVVSEDLENSAYHSALVYKPVGEGPFPATTLIGGFTNRKEDITWLGRHLASHGTIVIIFTPSNPYSTDPRAWSVGHVAAIASLKRENARRGSALEGLVDTRNLGLMGYSMGGAGAVRAANELGDEIKAVIPISAYQPVVPQTDAAYLFVAGNRDTVASSAIVRRVFGAMNTDSPRAFANIDGLDHYGVLNRGNMHSEIARMVTPWVKAFLSEDSRYMTFINGSEMESLLEGGDFFATPADYLYEAGE